MFVSFRTLLWLRLEGILRNVGGQLALELLVSISNFKDVLLVVLTDKMVPFI